MADSQGVSATGETGYTSFSEDRDQYIPVDTGEELSDEVYLETYERGWNCPWGSGRRIEPRRFDSAACPDRTLSGDD